MKTRTSLMAWLEYIAVRTIFMVMQVFPIEWNLGTARLVTRLWKRVLPRHHKRACAHLTQSLGSEYTDFQIRELADRSLESAAMFVVESICMPRLLTPSNWHRYMRVSNPQALTAPMLKGRGVILVTGHYGSFELLGHMLAGLGLRMVAVMRPLDNVYLNRFLVKTRRMRGLELLDKKGAATLAERYLAEGAMLGFIGDQDAGRKGVFVDFFGQPASTYKSIGLLAMSAEVPIIVGYARRKENTARYDIGIQQVIDPKDWADQDDPLRWITQTYTSALETVVRSDPSQYLWIHRRWKSKPKVKAKRTQEAI